ncbi:hypothetical protein [Flavobacterium aquicola]|uniref:Uncharacterized protein n=1 Tax=Flavobacterium aquicola TaxID=1682742 RepID=A0A3E0E7N1_9FLAO|nr:hypothetical protein [Flavobacterium aquicola]REG93006.1 hypothetical protein C8P67_114107 [Flavobacterium aquicola]
MIDNITMTKRTLSEVEKKNIIKSSRLVCNTLNGLIYYDNRTTKNFTGGLFIKIDPSNKLKITGSLHKYYSYLENGSLTNFDSFTMKDAKETFEKLILNTGINPDKVEITFFEIGLNVKLPIDTKKVLEKVHSIGKMEKVFFIEPTYKDARCITTEKHRDYRIFFKMYDKVFEMLDKNHKRTPKGSNIIRIETVHRRCEKLYLNDFFDMEFLYRLQNSFFNEWDKLIFYNDIHAPKGTQRSKIDLIRDIIYKGKNEVLKQYKTQYENKALSKRQFYSVRDFLENWEAIRHEFNIKNSKIVPFWNIAYSTEKQIVMMIL